MKKGFTLIELLGVLAILGIISILSIPPILNALKRQDNLKYEQFTSAVKDSAEKYLEQNRDLYKAELDNNVPIYISAGELIDKGYLIFDIKDPKTDSLVDKETLVEVTKNADGTLLYKYPEVRKVDPNPLTVTVLAVTSTVVELEQINPPIQVLEISKPNSTVRFLTLPNGLTGISISNEGIISGTPDNIVWGETEDVKTINLPVVVTNGINSIQKTVPFPINRDTDGDGIIDIEDPDDDSDSIPDGSDAQPKIPNY